jgi:hypothetical protein
MVNLHPIDHTAIKTSQILIVVLNILAFIFDAPWLAALVMALMIAGAFLGQPAFGFAYHRFLKPVGWAEPNVLLDHSAPHRFAQGFGGFVMLLGTLALWVGVSVLGWGLIWLVSALAALNAFGGFCVGCFVYYWLSRLRVPGFRQQPPPDTFPGMRPKGKVYES